MLKYFSIESRSHKTISLKFQRLWFISRFSTNFWNYEFEFPEATEKILSSSPPTLLKYHYSTLNFSWRNHIARKYKYWMFHRFKLFRESTYFVVWGRSVILVKLKRIDRVKNFFSKMCRYSIVWEILLFAFLWLVTLWLEGNKFLECWHFFTASDWF